MLRPPPVSLRSDLSILACGRTGRPLVSSMDHHAGDQASRVAKRLGFRHENGGSYSIRWALGKLTPGCVRRFPAAHRGRSSHTKGGRSDTVSLRHITLRPSPDPFFYYPTSFDHRPSSAGSHSLSGCAFELSHRAIQQSYDPICCNGHGSTADDCDELAWSRTGAAAVRSRDARLSASRQRHNQELLTLVDGLAFKIYPKGYWQLSWTLNAINVTCFLSVTLALRAYRSQQNPIPFWLFKLEHRPYRVKRIFKASRKSVGSPRDHDDRDIKSGQTPASLVSTQEEGEVRMGRFITASCVNCHLLLTSAYVLLLCLKVTESYIVRGPLASLRFSIRACWTCSCCWPSFLPPIFAAFGYIALLLPNVPPWLWNGTIVLVYLGILVIGLLCKISIAMSASKISQYRLYMYQVALHPDVGGLLNELGAFFTSSMPSMDEALRMVLLNIAKISYRESLIHKTWQQIMNGVVMLGGYALTISYLVILVTLSRRVAKELVQLRQSPPSHFDNNPPAPTDDFGLTNWPHHLSTFQHACPVVTFCARQTSRTAVTGTAFRCMQERERLLRPLRQIGRFRLHLSITPRRTHALRS